MNKYQDKINEFKQKNINTEDLQLLEQLELTFL